MWWLVVPFVVLVCVYLAAAYLILPRLWLHYEHQPGLAQLPMVTRTTQDIPGDPINVGLVGSKEDVIRAFAAAKWEPADPITLRSSIEIGASVLLDRPYMAAPVSTLLFDGRKQDLAFERPVGRSADQRHHVRFWLVLQQGAEGRPVWLGAASSTGVSASATIRARSPIISLPTLTRIAISSSAISRVPECFSRPIRSPALDRH